MPRTLSRKTLVLKNALNSSCVNHFVTKSPLSFQYKIAFSDGLSNFLKMLIRVIKMSFKNHPSIGRYYRDCKYFDWSKFKKNKGSYF